MAQGYSYSSNKIDLERNVQNNLKSWDVNIGWVLEAWMAARVGASLVLQLQ